MRYQFYHAVATGHNPDLNTVYKWKLSFDGSFAGKKDFVAFGVVPLSFGVKVQSGLSVYPIGMGWVAESAKSLVNFIPQLEACLTELEAQGCEVASPAGPVFIQVQFHTAADMASLWEVNGIGSASRSQWCCGAVVRNWW